MSARGVRISISSLIKKGDGNETLLLPELMLNDSIIFLPNLLRRRRCCCWARRATRASALLVERSFFRICGCCCRQRRCCSARHARREGTRSGQHDQSVSRDDAGLREETNADHYSTRSAGHRIATTPTTSCSCPIAAAATTAAAMRRTKNNVPRCHHHRPRGSKTDFVS